MFPHPRDVGEGDAGDAGGRRLLFELARAAAAHAAEDAPGRPVMLALSLSSHDYVNHVFGPGSWEAWDELRRLDRGWPAARGAGHRRARAATRSC